MGCLVADVIAHGIVEGIVGFNIDAVLFFHLLGRSHHCTFLFNEPKRLVDNPVHHDVLVAFVDDLHPLDNEGNSIIELIVHHHYKVLE